MIRAANLHEIVRETLRALDAELPGRFVTVEHRGDGEGEWDLDTLLPTIEAFVRAGLAATPADQVLWIRSDGRDDYGLRIELASTGAEKPHVLALTRFPS